MAKLIPLTPAALPPPNTYGVDFKFIDDNGKVVNLPKRATVRLLAECESERDFYTLFLTSSCVLGIDPEQFSTQGYIDATPTPDRVYVFRIERKHTTDRGDCIRLGYAVDVFTYLAIPGAGPLGAPKIDGEFTFPFGKLSGSLSLQPFISVPFTVEVCCTKTEDGCALSTKLL